MKTWGDLNEVAVLRGVCAQPDPTRSSGPPSCPPSGCKGPPLFLCLYVSVRATTGDASPHVRLGTQQLLLVPFWKPAPLWAVSSQHSQQLEVARRGTPMRRQRFLGTGVKNYSSAQGRGRQGAGCGLRPHCPRAFWVACQALRELVPLLPAPHTPYLSVHPRPSCPSPAALQPRWPPPRSHCRTFAHAVPLLLPHAPSPLQTSAQVPPFPQGPSLPSHPNESLD